MSRFVTTPDLDQSEKVYCCPTVTGTSLGNHFASPLVYFVIATCAPRVPSWPATGYVKVVVFVPQAFFCQLSGVVPPVSTDGLAKRFVEAALELPDKLVKPTTKAITSIAHSIFLVFILLY